MKNQQLLVVSSNAPHDAECVVDVDGTGKKFLPVVSIEIKGGRLVIACGSAPVIAAPANAPVVIFTNTEGGEGGGDDGEGGDGEGGDGTMDPPPDDDEGGGEGEGGEGERPAGATAPKTTPPPAAPAGAGVTLE